MVSGGFYVRDNVKIAMLWLLPTEDHEATNEEGAAALIGRISQKLRAQGKFQKSLPQEGAKNFQRQKVETAQLLSSSSGATSLIVSKGQIAQKEAENN